MLQQILFQDSSGDDYVPKDDAESDNGDKDKDSDDDGSDTSEVIHQVPDLSRFVKNNSASSNQSIRSNATIPTTNNKNERKYDKKFNCMYCPKSYAKLPRHLKDKHKDEEDVDAYIKAESQEEKNKILERIRNIGNHLHNREVLLKGEGELFVKYRPSKPGTNVEEFSPCPNCFGYFKRTDLWRHKCQLKPPGRLVEDLRIKDDSPDKFLKDFIKPSYYRMVVMACKSVSGFDSMFNKYGTPSLALKLGHSLRKCAKLLLGQAIEHRNKEQQVMADEFMKLLEMNWGDDISSHAMRTLNEAKKNTEKIVPLAQDVIALMKYLKSTSAEEYSRLLTLEDEELNASWSRFAQVLLVLIIAFNRRRSGGVSKMKLAEYESISKTGVNEAIEGSLSNFERKLARSFYRLEITAKRGNIVPHRASSTSLQKI